MQFDPINACPTGSQSCLEKAVDDGVDVFLRHPSASKTLEIVSPICWSKRQPPSPVFYSLDVLLTSRMRQLNDVFAVVDLVDLFNQVLPEWYLVVLVDHCVIRKNAG